jgi:hypothetical protein
VTIDMEQTAPRRVLRVSAVTAGLALALLASPAVAAPPESWEQPDNGPLLGDLVYLLGVPLLVVAVVTLLTYLPSMIRRQSAQPDLAFQERSEWFGGPRKGLDADSAAKTGSDTSGKGGASASW